jgi:hypothetical protein
MSFHSLQEILRACRCEPAAAPRPASKMDHRRNELLVAANSDADEPLHGAPSVFVSRGSPALRAVRSQSSRSSSNGAATALRRATVTIQCPAGNAAARTISRSLRRTRFRSTAHPTFRVVMMPERHGPPSGCRSTLQMTCLPARLVPFSLTQENSEAALRRWAAEGRMATPTLNTSDDSARAGSPGAYAAGCDA